MDPNRFDAILAALTAAPSRRAALRLLGGLGLAGLSSQSEAKKKNKKKKCAKAGQRTNKKRKKCCSGLGKAGTGRCVQPLGACTPTSCPPTACGTVPDGCGGTLSCACPANQICLRSGVCQPCTVTCTGTPGTDCGTALQTALNAGGTVYVCPGRYQGNFTIAQGLSNSVTVIGAEEGADPAGNTILDANDQGRVLTIPTGAMPVELERLRITGGNTSDTGAGILHLGTSLRMTECTVSGNTVVATVALGGGIAVGGLLEMTRCSVRNNHANATFGQNNIAQGGGIYANAATTLTDCLVENNHASTEGGGLWVGAGAPEFTVTLAGSTQVRDNAADFGGGILAGGMLVIAETCRVMENTADGPGNGGGIYFSQGTVTLQGADPSPIVVNNCHENCINVPKCAATPVSC